MMLSLPRLRSAGCSISNVVWYNTTEETGKNIKDELNVTHYHYMEENTPSKIPKWWKYFKSWEVSFEPSLSDHRHIPLTLEGCLLVHLIRNPRGSNWDSFQERLKGILERGPEMNMKDEAGLGLAILSVQQALILAYKKTVLLNLSGQENLLWSGYKLKCIRREVRQIFNKCQADIMPQSWELYRKTHCRYRKDFP